VSALACISVDLLGLPALCRSLSIPERSLPPAGFRAVAEHATARLAELLDRRGLPATFFVGADDLEDRASAAAIGALPRLGHELALLGPPLAHLARRAMAAALREGRDALERLEGHRPSGVRLAEGALGPALLEELEHLGFLYNSSIRCGLGVTRRPYRPSPRDPFRAGSAKLVELPAGTPIIPHVPLTGELLAWIPKTLMPIAFHLVRERDFVALHLQGVDLLDESDGLGHELAAKARAHRIPAAIKLQRLSEFLEWLRDGSEIATLEQAARWLAPRLGEPIG